jgi:hypothetical protein
LGKWQWFPRNRVPIHAMHADTYIYIHIHTYIYTYIQVRIHTYQCIRIESHTCTHIQIIDTPMRYIQTRTDTF